MAAAGEQSRRQGEARGWGGRLTARFEEFLSWELIDRVLFLLVLVEVSAAVALGFFPLWTWLPQSGPGFKAGLAWPVTRLCAVFVAANALLLLWGFWLRRRRGGRGALYLAAAAATGFQLFYYLYLFGFQSTAVLVLAGAIAAGRLILGRPLGLLTLAVSVGGLCLLTALTAAGSLAYAPLMRDEAGRSLAQTPFIGWTSTLLVCGVLLALYAVVDFVTQRMWRAIWELGEANEELRRAQAALVRAESLAAVGSLVTGAAHELRNPLGSSGGLLQSLRDEIAELGGLSGEQKNEIAATLERALEGQGRASDIVERLYRLTDDLETGGSQAVLGDFVAPLRERYPGLRVELDPAAGQVRVRHALIRTVLPNLIDNALAAGGNEPPTLEVHLTPPLRSPPSPLTERGPGGEANFDSPSPIPAGVFPRNSATRSFSPFLAARRPARAMAWAWGSTSFTNSFRAWRGMWRSKARQAGARASTCGCPSRPPDRFRSRSRDHDHDYETDQYYDRDRESARGRARPSSAGRRFSRSNAGGSPRRARRWAPERSG